MTIPLNRPVVMALIVIAVVLGMIVTIRLVTPEDTWRCESGTWVKHGQPSGPAPTSPCGT